MKIIEQTPNDSKLRLKWLLIIFTIKSVLFTYFAFQFYEYARKELVTSWIVVEQADTISYYTPAAMFVDDGEYAGMCRMPGLAPIYALYAYPFGKDVALICAVITQFLFSILSTFLLAIAASRIIPHKLAFPAVALIYSLSSFVSIWDHTLLSDSFATSFLIISFYLLTEFTLRNQMRYLLMAGFWLTWSIFIRQIGILFIPVFPIIWWAWRKDSFKSFVKHGLLFITPFIVFISLWTYRNYEKEKVFVPLIKPIADCWTSYTPQFMKITQLLITWGEDAQYWVAGSSAEWFNKPVAQIQAYPFRTSLNTTVCNADSILQLQQLYVAFKNAEDTLLRKNLGDDILEKCDLMISTYKTERPADYYFTNRLKMMWEFLFPTRLDNTPGPAFSQMNIVQKGVKIGYYILLILVNIAGLLATIYALYRKHWHMLLVAIIPWILIITLAGIMGYIEQRYLVPAYPFFIILLVYFIAEILTAARKRKVLT